MGQQSSMGVVVKLPSLPISRAFQEFKEYIHIKLKKPRKLRFFNNSLPKNILGQNHVVNGLAKVQFFWEGHKNLGSRPHSFVIYHQYHDCTVWTLLHNQTNQTNCWKKWNFLNFLRKIQINNNHSLSFAVILYP